MLLRIVLAGITIQLVYSQCSFPSSLIGSWIRADDKIEFTITNTNINGFNYVIGLDTINTFSCREISNNNYLLYLAQPGEAFATTFHIHLCFSVDILGPNSLVLTDLASVSNRVKYLGNPANAFVDLSGIRTGADVCTVDINTRTSSVFYRKNIGSSPGAIAVTCPSLLLGDYTYVLDDTKCTNNSSLSVCTDRTSMRADYSLCPDEVGYSAGGVMDCMGSVNRGGVTYLWTYNRDATVDDVNRFTTACFAISENGGSVLMTSHPKNCQPGQDPTTIASPGHKFNLSAIKLCPFTTETPPSPPGSASIPAIAGGSAAAVIIIAMLVIIIIFLMLRTRNKRKARISDETPTSNRSQSSRTAENGAVKKSEKTTPSTSPSKPGSKAPSQNGGVSSSTVAAGTTAVLATVNETNKASNSGTRNVQEGAKPKSEQSMIPEKDASVKNSHDSKADEEGLKKPEHSRSPETSVSGPTTAESSQATSAGVDKSVVDSVVATTPVALAVTSTLVNEEHSASSVQKQNSMNKFEKSNSEEQSENRPGKENSDKEESQKGKSDGKADEGKSGKAKSEGDKSEQSDKGKSEEKSDKGESEKGKSEEKSDKGKSEKEKSEQGKKEKSDKGKSEEKSDKGKSEEKSDKGKSEKEKSEQGKKEKSENGKSEEKGQKEKSEGKKKKSKYKKSKK